METLLEYSQNEKFIIGLTLLSIYPNCKINLFLKKFGILDFNDIHNYKDEIIKNFGLSFFADLETITNARVSTYIKNLTSRNIFCLTYINEKYPDKLLEINDFPIVLFYKGDIDLINSRCFAIVGTRSPSFYGKNVTEFFSKNLATAGLTIVSGLASGVDKIAHEQALNYGKTIAVLGGGFNHIYPAMNYNLFTEIEKKGLVISEYKPQSRPTRYSFPLRNRIIAGLSDGVLITEAGEKSGALHTKNYASMYGKNIFAIPCNINNEKGIGCNLLIKSNEAKMVLNPDDILDFYKINHNIKQCNQQSSCDELIIINLLKDGERTVDELLDLSKLDINHFYLSLTTLELQGKIKKQVGNVYSLSI